MVNDGVLDLMGGMIRAGLDVAVMGTALLHADNPAEDMAAIRRMGA